MSKGGGAGKVYFILYLAVLLELLIIIVERDDAEEALKKEKLALEQKSKRIQMIAETIIQALRGSQTSLSSTSDQSMTLGDVKEPEREFSVKVRISDPTKDVVDSLALTIFRNNSPMTTIDMATDTVQFPRVKMGQDYIFKYKFKPMFGEGEYKLDFKAKTNQVVGVAQNAKADDTVKIGAVHLTVGELKEVEKGITENVALKGFIDSLLGDQYRDFSSNIGHNDFIVNVKRNVFEPIHLYPQVTDFIAFPGMELPNPIKIDGATSAKTEITKIEGPGEIKRIDTNWVWIYNPGKDAIGTNQTVKFKANANRGGGAADMANSQFSVTVKDLKPVAGDSGIYSPWDEDAKTATPFTKVHFSINGKYADLDGQYKLVLTLDGAPYKEILEPTFSFVPTFLEMEGKKLGVSIQFKSVFMHEYKELRHDEFVIAAPPLNVGGGGSRVYVDEKVVKFKAGYGIEGDYTPTGGDLTVQADGGYFDSKATKTSDYDFTLRLVKVPTTLKRDGLPVKVTFTDPTSGDKATRTITIMPKKK